MMVLRKLTLVWAALLAWSAFFTALHYIAPPPAAVAPPIAMMPFMLGFVSVAIVVVSFVLPRQVLRASFRAAGLPVTDEPDPTAPADYRAQQPTRRVLRVDDALFTSICVRYQAPLIVSIALSESVGLFGVVLDRLAFPMSQCAPFFVAGTLLIAARAPTKRAILAAVERALGVAVIDAAQP